jgi:hypothetical protein
MRRALTLAASATWLALAACAPGPASEGGAGGGAGAGNSGGVLRRDASRCARRSSFWMPSVPIGGR